MKNDEFLVTVRFSPSAVIILPFLLTTVMGVGSYTVPPFDTENGLVARFHIGLVACMSIHLELLDLRGVAFTYDLSHRVNVIGLW